MRPTKRTLHAVRSLAVVVALIGIVLSPAWETPAPVVDLNPPYTEPSVTEIFPDDEAVAAAMGTAMVRVMDSPPDSRAYVLDTAPALDYRRMGVDQAWERRWHSYDEVQQVRVVAEINTVSALSPLVAVCDPSEEFDVLGASRSGVVISTQDLTEVCASIDVGRQHLEVRVITADADHEERAADTLRDLVPPVADQVHPVADLGWDGSNPRTGSQIRRAQMAGLLLALGAATLPGLLAQVPRWRRSLTRRSAAEVNSEHFDIEAERKHHALQLSALRAVRVVLLVWALWLTFTFKVLASSLVAVGLLLMAYLLGVWLERRLSTDPRNRRRPRMLRGPAAVPSWLGVLGSALMLAGAMALWTLGNGMSGFGSGNAELATWQVQSAALMFQGVAIVVFAWAILPIALGRRISMALMRDRAPEGGRPTLLLRTFGDDQLKLWVQRRDRVGFLDSLVMKRRERFEEILSYTLARYGPPVAIGQPGQILPPGLGGQRLTFSHDTWQEGVRRLADEAALICLTVGRTQGLSWEMNHVASGGLLHRSLFVVPPVAGHERQERLRIVADCYGLNPRVFDTGSSARVVLAFCWPLGWSRPFVVVSTSADDLSYDIALERCAEMLLAGAPSPPMVLEAPPAVPAYRDIGLPPAPALAGSSWRWGRKIWIANLAITSVAVPFLLPMLTGDPIGSREPMSRILTLPESVYTVQVVGGTPQSSYAVVDNHLVIRGDFTTSTVEVVGELEARSRVVRRDDDLLVYIGAGMAGERLMVGVMNLVTGDQLWTADLSERASFVAVTDESVAVPQPSEERLLLWDLATGSSQETVDLPCRPWDAVGDGETVWVSCPAEGLLLTVEDGAVGERYEVPRGATRILQAASVPYVHVPRESVVAHPVETDFRLWSRLPRPNLAAAEGVVAAEGVERVSILSPTGMIRRNTMVPMSSLSVQENGTVQYASRNQWVLLLISADQL